MSTKYVVIDWAGNHKPFYGEFDSFEEAWGKIRENFEHLSEREFVAQMEEFEVIKIEDN